MSRLLESRTDVSRAPEKCSPEEHNFLPPKPSDDRSPCPALNVLANHGYISRDGRHIKFLSLISTLVYVYNISYPLAFFLSVVGFLTCGKFSLHPVPVHHPRHQVPIKHVPLVILVRLLQWAIRAVSLPWRIYWTIDLKSLSERGPYSISHDASLVHVNGAPSTSPDPRLVEALVQFSIRAHGGDPGLTLADLACLHSSRRSSSQGLNHFHEQIALGECGLAWAVLRTHDTSMLSRQRQENGLIPLSRIEQLFGEERLPDGWWDENGSRPPDQIGLIEARGCANDVAELSWKLIQ